ncbi:8599_t:CDS:2 [Entrophospora sp. SA101]|nr:8599_t:CDS:2 [Entrophospora sp. SA101]
MDNLWLDVGKILQEKMINTGTNIRLVSCDGIQINNNPVVGKLVDVGGVARYNINFLPEENESTTGYDVHLSKIAYNTFYAGIWNDHTDFNSILVYSLCFQLPINPLRNGDLLEYAYRNRIGDVFLDINNVIYMKTGEIENTDCKVQ